ncbi:hypothetical protein [Daejeonella sp.]|uniref:hypothetical protein n=1 Tax=Daejeonella sp. TaxID=2805397 RepID=UPI0025BF0767|nr:hypothetical protein [Daejeonella sp.]
MHPISDKELDKLFQQRFEDLQVEPSNAVWEKISNSLDKKKPAKKTFSIFWMAAASIVVVLSAGLWFTKSDEKIIAKGSIEIVQEENKVIEQDAVSEGLKVTSEEESVPVLISKSLENKVANDLPKAEPTLVNEVVKVIPEIKASEEPSGEVIVSNVIKRPIVIQPKQPVKVPARYSGDQSALDLSQPDLSREVLTASISAQDRNSTDGFNSRNRKVKGVGGLVNFVIAQVDKREDKLIEFTESDEGTEVSGINLGLLKIKSKK